MGKPEIIWAAEAAAFTHDPLGFVYFAFRWGEGDLTDYDGPDEWARDLLTSIGQGLLTPGQAIQIAIASGHGIGKSACVAWLILWAICTHEDARGVVTANTDTQLRTKTWAELAKWFFRCTFASLLFELTATAVYSKDPGHEKTWRVDMVPWSERNTEAFAGLHNQGKRVLLIFDEASAIPDVIWETAEGALTDANTEIIWFVAGNPTRNTGRFRECFGRFKHRWLQKQIDSRTVKITNKKQIEEWVDDYGEDSDFVRVRVRGVFPRAGSMQFISSEAIEGAAKREPTATMYDAFVMGVDVARFGDDESVIYFRKGRDGKTHPPLKFRGLDNMQLAAKVADMYESYQVDAVFVDGGGNGGGVVDRLRQLHVPVFDIQFGAAADLSQPGQELICYANKAAEMWGSMKTWLEHGAIPDDVDLRGQLEGREYGYVLLKGRDAIQLESKKDMKKRGLSSPDIADALCFVGNTKIQTPNGEVPIAFLKVGDYVCTPFGDTRIVKKWESPTNKLTLAKFSNGSHLKGKGEHKIFTWGNGQTDLDALSLTDEVIVFNQWGFLWKCMVWITKGLDIQFKPLVDTIRAESTVTVRAFFIATCGLMLTARYRKAMTFITRMTTGATSTLKTLLPSRYQRIADTTCSNVKQTETCSLHPERHWEKLPSGTNHQKELNGIGRMPSGNGSQPRPKQSNVRRVECLMKPLWRIHNTVHQLVPSVSAIAGTSPKRASAFIVVWNLLLTAIGKRRVVPVSVQTENVPLTAVYNLTLENHNAYYANGILVYNCLTFAYKVMPNRTAGGQAGGNAQSKKIVTEYDPFA